MATKRPPPLPPRRTPPSRPEREISQTHPPLPPRRRVTEPPEAATPVLPIRPRRRVAEAENNFLESVPKEPIIPTRPVRATARKPPPPPSRAATEPPPIPLHSKPSFQTIKAHGEPGACLVCRDFSLVDNHASRFPRHQVSSIAWLSSQLCDQFPSSTDKARAIFTWLHHNVAYDVDAFFGNRIRGKTPEETLTSGLAVCQGYAELFEALAKSAGLDVIVVSGHGKGYGFSQLGPNDPIPAKKATGHAWNAVRIETGWHLVDACWGAGNVGGPGKYSKAFKPTFFVSSPAEFGTDHFPANDAHQFAPIQTWEHYITNGNKPPRPFFYGANGMHDFSQAKTTPAFLKITQEGWYRFHFEKICEHWRVEPRKELLLLIKVEGDTRQRRGSVDAKNGQMYPVVPEEQGRGWYANAYIPRGATHAWAYFLTAYGDMSVEGLQASKFLQYWGKVGSQYSSFARWDVEIP